MANAEDFELGTMTLILEDDSEEEFGIDAIFPVEDPKYIALVPLNSEEDDTVYFYYYSEDESGEPVIDNIESDEEQEAAMDAYDEFIDYLEYQELLDDDEDEE